MKYWLSVGKNVWEHMRSLEVSDREEERWILCGTSLGWVGCGADSMQVIKSSVERFHLSYDCCLWLQGLGGGFHSSMVHGIPSAPQLGYGLRW